MDIFNVGRAEAAGVLDSGNAVVIDGFLEKSISELYSEAAVESWKEDRVPWSGVAGFTTIGDFG